MQQNLRVGKLSEIENTVEIDDFKKSKTQGFERHQKYLTDSNPTLSLQNKVDVYYKAIFLTSFNTPGAGIQNKPNNTY